jgi:hypothetical protein
MNECVVTLEGRKSGKLVFRVGGPDRPGGPLEWTCRRSVKAAVGMGQHLVGIMGVSKFLIDEAVPADIRGALWERFGHQA